MEEDQKPHDRAARFENAVFPESEAESLSGVARPSLRALQTVGLIRSASGGLPGAGKVRAWSGRDIVKASVAGALQNAFGWPIRMAGEVLKTLTCEDWTEMIDSAQVLERSYAIECHDRLCIYLVNPNNSYRPLGSFRKVPEYRPEGELVRVNTVFSPDITHVPSPDEVPAMKSKLVLYVCRIIQELIFIRANQPHDRLEWENGF
jgi:hypothetical protein